MPSLLGTQGYQNQGGENEVNDSPSSGVAQGSQNSGVNRVFRYYEVRMRLIALLSWSLQGSHIQ
jgi:hypothetical protein